MTQQAPSLEDLLATYTALLHEYGVGSQEEEQFARQHADVPEFAELAHLSKLLKDTLFVGTTSSNQQLLLEQEVSPLVADLLQQHAALLNQYGVGSVEADRFAEEHAHVPEFSSLARLSNALKRALQP